MFLHKHYFWYSQLSLSQYKALSLFTRGTKRTCGLIPGHNGFAHIPRAQSIKTIYLARWELMLTQVLFVHAAGDRFDVFALLYVAEMLWHSLNPLEFSYLVVFMPKVPVLPH